MMQIFTPHPDWKQLLVLPNPEWGDFTRLVNTLQVKRSMTGQTVVTHIQKQEGKSLEWQFNLTRYKSLELLEFYLLHSGQKCLVIDHRNDSHIGYIQFNPLELEKIRSGSNGERVNVNLNFETVE